MNRPFLKPLGMRKTRRIQDSLFWIILAIFLVFFLFIFVWMFVSSFKPNLLIVSDPAGLVLHSDAGPLWRGL